MPVNNHVVIILDVNPIRRIPTPEQTNLTLNSFDVDVKYDINNGMSNAIVSTQSIKLEVPEDHPPDSPETMKNYQPELLKSITDTVLAILCQHAFDRQGAFHCSRLLWSYKLFDSSVELNSAGKIFHSFTIESFESFENTLKSILSATSPSGNVTASSKARPDVNRLEFLSTAIKSVVSDLNWPEPHQDEPAEASKVQRNKNTIYAMLRVPRNDHEMLEFSPNAIRTRDFMAELLPKEFGKKMLLHEVQLNFMDLWMAIGKQNPSIKLEVEWDGVTYPQVFNKILHYHNGGRVIPFKRQEDMPYLVLPSTYSILKTLLATSSSKEQKEPKSGNGDLTTIQKLRSIKSTTTTTSKSKLTGYSTKVSPVDSEQSGARDRRGNSTLRVRISKLPKPNRSQNHRISKKDTWYSGVQNRRIKTDPDEHAVARRYAVDQHPSDFAEMVQMSRKRKYEEAERKQQREYTQMELGMKKESFWGAEDEDDIDEEEISNFGPHDYNEYEQEFLTPSSQRQSTGLAMERSYRSHGGQGLHISNHRERPTRKVYPTSRSPGIHTQDFKRIRRDEGTVALMERGNSLKQRHSHPETVAINQNARNNIRRSSGNGSRGRQMLVEVEKRARSIPPPKSVINVETNYERNGSTQKKKSKSLTSMKNRFNMLLDQSNSRSHDSSNPIDHVIDKFIIFKDMVLLEEDTCLLLAVQAMVSVLAEKLRQLESDDVRGTLEEILIVPFDKLNLMVIQKKNSDQEEAAFRECQLQILLRLEISFITPLEYQMVNKENQYLQEEVIRILNLITAYRKQPPISDFINDVLVPSYNNTHGKLLLEVSHAVNITVSPLLAKYDDNESQDDFSDQESVASSTHSSMCPGDSVSTIGFNSPHHKPKAVLHSSFLYMHSDKRNKIMVPAKLNTQPVPSARPKIDSKAKLLIRSATAVRSSPKRVRRNLFDVQESHKDPKDSKHLISLMATSSFSRSSSLFKSPSSKKSYSPHSPLRSPFFRAAARSRRRLVMDPENDDVGHAHQWEPLHRSPGLLHGDVICPESPATPIRKRREGSSVGVKSVVQESPEVVNKTGYTSRPISERVNSISFYSSSGAESQKSRAWARSGAKLMAARIKDSVDMSSSLTLNDLEFLSDPTGPKGTTNHRTLSGDSKLDGNRIPQSPVPCSSKSMENFNFQVSHAGEIGFSIESLMTSEILPTSSDIFNMNTSNSSSLNTPSKRVQFSLRDNLVNTPSPSRPIHGTPKSILKDGGSGHLPDNV